MNINELHQKINDKIINSILSLTVNDFGEEHSVFIDNILLDFIDNGTLVIKAATIDEVSDDSFKVTGNFNSDNYKIASKSTTCLFFIKHEKPQLCCIVDIDSFITSFSSLNGGFFGHIDNAGSAAQKKLRISSCTHSIAGLSITRGLALKSNIDLKYLGNLLSLKSDVSTYYSPFDGFETNTYDITAFHANENILESLEFPDNTISIELQTYRNGIGEEQEAQFNTFFDTDIVLASELELTNDKELEVIGTIGQLGESFSLSGQITDGNAFGIGDFVDLIGNKTYLDAVMPTSTKDYTAVGVKKFRIEANTKRNKITQAEIQIGLDETKEFTLFDFTSNIFKFKKLDFSWTMFNPLDSARRSTSFHAHGRVQIASQYDVDVSFYHPQAYNSPSDKNDYYLSVALAKESSIPIPDILGWFDLSNSNNELASDNYLSKDHYEVSDFSFNGYPTQEKFSVSLVIKKQKDKVDESFFKLKEVGIVISKTKSETNGKVYGIFELKYGDSPEDLLEFEASIAKQGKRWTYGARTSSEISMTNLLDGFQQQLSGNPDKSLWRSDMLKDITLTYIEIEYYTEEKHKHFSFNNGVRIDFPVDEEGEEATSLSFYQSLDIDRATEGDDWTFIYQLRTGGSLPLGRILNRLVKKIKPKYELPKMLQSYTLEDLNILVDSKDKHYKFGGTLLIDFNEDETVLKNGDDEEEDDDPNTYFRLDIDAKKQTKTEEYDVEIEAQTYGAPIPLGKLTGQLFKKIDDSYKESTTPAFLQNLEINNLYIYYNNTGTTDEPNKNYKIKGDIYTTTKDGHYIALHTEISVEDKDKDSTFEFGGKLTIDDHVFKVDFNNTKKVESKEDDKKIEEAQKEAEKATDKEANIEVTAINTHFNASWEATGDNKKVGEGEAAYAEIELVAIYKYFGIEIPKALQDGGSEFLKPKLKKIDLTLNRITTTTKKDGIVTEEVIENFIAMDIVAKELYQNQEEIKFLFFSKNEEKPDE